MGQWFAVLMGKRLAQKYFLTSLGYLDQQRDGNEVECRFNAV